MRTNTSYKDGVNVAAEEKDPDSVLNFYRRMLALRKQHSPCLIFGTYEGIEPDNEKTMHYYKRSFQGEELYVALNFSGEEQPVAVPAEKKLRLLLSTSTKPAKEDVLQPYEGRMYGLE
jgi:glycosidase